MHGLSKERAGAMEDAATCGETFLDTLGKTDINTMSFDEWMAFVATVCNEYDEGYDRRTEAAARTRDEAAVVDAWQRSDAPAKPALDFVPQIKAKTPAEWQETVRSGYHRNAVPNWDAPRCDDLDDEIPF